MQSDSQNFAAQFLSCDREAAVRLHRLLSEELGLSLDYANPATTLAEIRGLNDSLDIVELGMAIEEEWNIGLPDLTLEPASNLADLVRALTNGSNAGSGGPGNGASLAKVS